MAEGARLESVFRGNSNVGSNPTLSASLSAESVAAISGDGDHERAALAANIHLPEWFLGMSGFQVLFSMIVAIGETTSDGISRIANKQKPK